MFGGVGVADHRDVRFGGEGAGRAMAYDLVVVQQEHADRVLFPSMKLRVSVMVAPGLPR